METTNDDVQRAMSGEAIPAVVRTLMGDLSATVFVIGNEFRPTWCSNPEGLLFGRDAATWGSGALIDALHPSDQVWMSQMRHEILEDPGLTVQGHVRVQYPDGEYVTVLLTAVNRFDDPDIGGLVITATPVVESSPRTHDEIHRVRAAKRQHELLAQVRAEVEDRLSAISTSATSITADGTATHTRDVHVAAINTATNELRSLLSDVVDLSKVTSGTMELDSIVFSPERLLSDVVSAFDPVCKAKQLDLTLRLGPDLPSQVKGDPARLEQVIHHLTSNAVSSTRDGDVRIDVIVTEETRIQFRISHSGTGGNSGALDPFSPDRRRQSDADVRLSIARQIVDLMDGSFGYETSDRGTAIWFDVLFGHARRVDDRPADPKPAPSASKLTAHVLVVDDSDVNRLLATSQLERLGHTFSTAESGLEALEALATDTFDIVLMDWHMPGVDGLEATRRWRAEHDPDHALPIITMTASAMAGDRERCLDAGASDYLSKPVSISDLGTMITRWVDPLGEAPPPPPSEQASNAGPVAYDESKISALIMDLGDLAVVRSIVKAFLEMVPQYRSAAEVAFAEGDRRTVRRCAHTLKSTALMLGTDELAESCIMLEAAAAPDQSIDLAALVADFARCCLRAEATLADLAAKLDVNDASKS